MQSEMICKLRRYFVATPSNCGDFLKLCLPSQHGNIVDGWGNDLRYGKNDKDEHTHCM